MKKIYPAVIVILPVLFFMISCGTTKKQQEVQVEEKVENTDKNIPGEVVQPCTGEEYRSDTSFFRYTAVGTSMDETHAKNKAYNEARSGLAEQISTMITRANDNYFMSIEHQNKEELQEVFETATLSSTKQTLKGSMPVCETLIMTEDKKYKYYVCMEVANNKVLQDINNQLSENEKLKILYNRERYKKSYETEQLKLGE